MEEEDENSRLAYGSSRFCFSLEVAEWNVMVKSLILSLLCIQACFAETCPHKKPKLTLSPLWLRHYLKCHNFIFVYSFPPWSCHCRALTHTHKGTFILVFLGDVADTLMAQCSQIFFSFVYVFASAFSLFLAEGVLFQHF